VGEGEAFTGCSSLLGWVRNEPAGTRLSRTAINAFESNPNPTLLLPLLEPGLPKYLKLVRGHQFKTPLPPLSQHSNQPHTLESALFLAKQCLEKTSPLRTKTRLVHRCPPFKPFSLRSRVPPIDFSGFQLHRGIRILVLWLNTSSLGAYMCVQYERPAVSFVSGMDSIISQQHKMQVWKGGKGKRAGWRRRVEKSVGRGCREVWRYRLDTLVAMQCFKAAWVVNVLHRGWGCH